MLQITKQPEFTNIDRYEAKQLRFLFKKCDEKRREKGFFLFSKKLRTNPKKFKIETNSPILAKF